MLLCTVSWQLIGPPAQMPRCLFVFSGRENVNAHFTASLNTLSTPVEFNFNKEQFSSDILTALVEVNFDRAYVAHKMALSPAGSVYHVIYDCLFADCAPENVSRSSGVSD